MFKSPVILFALGALIWWIVAGMSLSDGDKYAALDLTVATMFSLASFSFFMSDRQLSKVMTNKPDGEGHYNGLLQIGDVIDYFETVKPRWWQTGSEEVKHRKLRITKVYYQGHTTHYTGEFVG